MCYKVEFRKFFNSLIFNELYEYNGHKQKKVCLTVEKLGRLYECGILVSFFSEFTDQLRNDNDRQAPR